MGVGVGMSVRSARAVGCEALFADTAQKRKVERMLALLRIVFRTKLGRRLEPNGSFSDECTVANNAQYVGARVEVLQPLHDEALGAGSTARTTDADLDGQRGHGRVDACHQSAGRYHDVCSKSTVDVQAAHARLISNRRGKQRDGGYVSTRSIPAAAGGDRSLRDAREYGRGLLALQGGHDAGGQPVELRVVDLEEYSSKGADDEAAADDNSTGSEIGGRGARHADGDGAG